MEEQIEEQTDSKPTKSFIYLLILALGVAIALIFFMRSQTEKPTTIQKEIQQIETQSSSDEVDAIEADLESTDLEEIDRELDEIEAELNQSF